MKKFILLLLAAFTLCFAEGQIYSKKGDVKTDINAKIIVNTTKAITPDVMKKILIGLWDYDVDSLWISGTYLYYRRGGLVFNVPVPNAIDTSNKWISIIYKKAGTDSVFYKKGGNIIFAFRTDSTGGGSGLIFPNTIHKYLNGYGAFPTLNTDSITQGSTNLFNQTHTGDATGSTALSVVGIRNNLIPSLSTGLLKWTGSAWTFDNSSYLTSFTNIYNSDGTLAGNRAVSGGSHSLAFNNVSAFNTTVESGSTNTAWVEGGNQAGTRYVDLTAINGGVTSQVTVQTGINLITPADHLIINNLTEETSPQWILVYDSLGKFVRYANVSSLPGGTGGSGINQLTGDILAGPGTGSQVATLPTVNSNVGIFGDGTHVAAPIVNAKGLITGISNVPINFPALAAGNGDSANISTGHIELGAVITRNTELPINNDSTGSERYLMLGKYSGTNSYKNKGNDAYIGITHNGGSQILNTAYGRFVLSAWDQLGGRMTFTSMTGQGSFGKNYIKFENNCFDVQIYPDTFRIIPEFSNPNKYSPFYVTGNSSFVQFPKVFFPTSTYSSAANLVMLVKDSITGQLYHMTIPSSGSGITSLNGLTGATQTFATPGTTGTAPNWASTGTAHTLHIPMASASSVTAGLISKTQYDVFNAKQDALVSGTNIKTINGNSLLGSGNLTISGGAGSTNYWTGTGNRIHADSNWNDLGIKYRAAPLINTNNIPTSVLDSLSTITDARYNYAGVIGQFPDHTWWRTFRPADDHIGTNYYNAIQFSSDGGRSWHNHLGVLNAIDTIYRRGVGYASAGAWGASTTSGRFVHFTADYDTATNTYVRMGYTYTDDRAATWSSFNVLSHGSMTNYLPQDRMFEIGDNLHAMFWYGNDGTNYNTYMITSGDDWNTASSPILVFTSTSQYTEPAGVYAKGRNIIVLIRLEGNGVPFRMVTSKFNGAAGTWVDRGNTVSPLINTSASPATMAYVNLNGKGAICITFSDRSTGKVLGLFGYVDSIMANGVNGIDGASLRTLYTGTSGNQTPSPSIYFPDDKFPGLGIAYTDMNGGGAGPTNLIMYKIDNPDLSPLEVNNVRTKKVSSPLTVGGSDNNSTYTIKATDYTGAIASSGQIPAFKLNVGSSGSINGAYVMHTGQWQIGGTQTPFFHSAILDLSSTTMGFCPPRMTTSQINSIAVPSEGMIAFDLTLHVAKYYDGSTWTTFGAGGGSVALGSFGSSPDAKGASISGSTITMQPADGTHPGEVSTTTQTFAGDKTFTGTINAAAYTGGLPVSYAVAASDEGTALTTGTAKVTFHIPENFTLTSVMIELVTVQTSGSIFTVDVKKNGSTIFSTKPTIDNTEETNLTAATAAVISTSSFSAGDKVIVNIDQIGDGTAKGLKVWLIGHK